LRRKRQVVHEVKDERKNLCSCGARFTSARELRNHLAAKAA
jgi:hypothetical protein